MSTVAFRPMISRLIAALGLCLLSVVASAQTTVKYIHTDALGGVVAITDSAGIMVEARREYEPYGYQSAPAIQDGPGYAGHVQDVATDLTYMQQRYYDPWTGRFLSVDPVTAYSSEDWRQLNRYAYAFNNPYRFTDPDGRNPVAIGAIACARIPACAAAATVSIVYVGRKVAETIEGVRDYIHQSESNKPRPTSEGGAPPLPEGLMGEGQTPRGSGNSVTSGPLKPEFGGSGDYESDLRTLAGETRPAGSGDAAPPGAQIGENGVFGRENSSGGRSIDIPANGDKPHETLHHPRDR